jgi:hypothetical protein
MAERLRSFRDIAERYRPTPGQATPAGWRSVFVLAVLLITLLAAMVTLYPRMAQSPATGGAPPGVPADETGGIYRELFVLAQAFRDGDHAIEFDLPEMSRLLRIFWERLDAVGVRARADAKWDGDALFAHPEEYRGRILRFRGTVLQSRTYPLPDPWEGGPGEVHLCYVEEERTGRTFEAIFLNTEDTPPFRGNRLVQTPQGALFLLDDFTEFDGLFLRLHWYERYQPGGQGPVLPAAVFVVRGYRFATPSRPPAVGLFLSIAGAVVFLLVLAVCGIVLIRQRRRDREGGIRTIRAALRRARKAPPESTPIPPA